MLLSIVLSVLVVGALAGFQTMNIARTDLPKPMNLTQHIAHDRYPSWSPDGKYIAFESDRSGSWNIYLMNRDGKNIRALIESTNNERFPAWHPSGNRIVFQSDRNGKSDLFILSLQNNNVTSVATLEGDELFPTWSPDGDWITFTLLKNGILGHYKIREDGTDFQPVFSNSDRNVWPRWSPDGTRLAYHSRPTTEGSEDDLYIFSVHDGSIKQVTNKPGHDFCPEWSPDGNKLVAASVDPGIGRWMRVFNLDGSIALQFAGDMFRITEPSWSPDGQCIAFAGQRTDSVSYDIFIQQVVPK